MISRMMGDLSARRNSLQEKEKGFTLIELLVVIVIIGILAAIAIPVYLGVQNNAKDSAAKSDLSNAKIAVVAYQADKTTLPATLDTAMLGTYGFTLNTGDTITWSPVTPAPAGPAFCIVATSVTNKTFYATDSSGVVDTKPATGC
jgi:type IV pilus assembly protein PilA